MNNPLPRSTMADALDYHSYEKKLRLERKSNFRSFIGGKSNRKNKPVHGKRKY